MRRIIIILLVVGVLAAGAFFVIQSQSGAEGETSVEANPAETVDTIAVDTGVDTVSAEGVVLPLRQAQLSFETGGGQVAERLVEVGQSVAAGDPLLRLDTTDLDLAVSQAEAGLEAAQAGLTSANAQLTAAQVSLDTAQLRIDAAEANLALIQADPLPEEISVTLKTIAAADAGVNLAAANRDVSLEVNGSQVRAAEAQVASAISNLDSIQRQYDDIIDYCFDGPDGNEICPLYGPTEEAKRAELGIAQTNVTAAQARLDEANAGATPARRNAAGAGVTVAIANRNSAEQQLALLLADPLPERIEQAQIEVAQAEASVTQAEDGVAQAEAAVVQAEAAVSVAQAALDSAVAALDKMTLRAPFDGTVADIFVDEGEIASGAVITLADISGWLVETTDLTELDVVNVKTGLPVNVTLDALPNETLSGTVEDISSVSSLVRGDVTYVVTVRLDDNDELPIRWGMTTLVEIDVE